MSDDTVRRLAEQVMRERADCCHDDEGNSVMKGVRAGIRVAAEQLIPAVEKLLEWMPFCSIGSSGDIRARAVRKAIAELRALADPPTPPAAPEPPPPAD